MAYTASVSLGSPIGIGITSVKLYECSGNNSGCTALANYTNVAVSLFNPTYLVTGITDSNRWIKVEPVGACSGTTQNLQVSGFPGPTSTPAPTATTPSATPAPTASTTPGPTATAPAATQAPTATPTRTPTPTPTVTSNCVTSVQFEVDTAGEVRYVTCCGATKYVTFGIGPQVINECIQSGSLYPTGAAISFVSYGATSCVCPPPTSTPTSTPTYYSVTVQLAGLNGNNGNLQIWQSADGTPGSFQQSLTLTTTDSQFSQSNFNGTPGYYYYMIVARTSGTSATRLNLYTQVGLTDFNPGPINSAWCSGPNSTPLQSDVFQLPNPIQSRNSITFFGNLDTGCL